MKLKFDDDRIITIIYALSGIMLIGQFFGLHSLTSIAYALSFLVVFALWILQAKTLRSFDIVAIAIIVLSLINALISCSTLTINYFKNWLVFSFVFLYFSVCVKSKLKSRTIRRLFLMNTLVVAFCILAYLIRYDEVFYVTFTGIKYLVFDFYNPNSLALFLFCLAATAILSNSFLNRFRRIKQIITICLFAILIAQTLSRTVLIAYILFLTIYFVFKKRKSYYLPKCGMFKVLVALFPLLFAIVYMFFIESVSRNNFLSFLVSEGKELDSRQLVWEYAIDLFKTSPFIGSYGELLNSSVASQVHNSHLNVLASYGIIVLALVIIFLLQIMTEVFNNAKNTRMELSIWAFIVCLALGSGESILFSGGLSFYLLVGQFLLISNINN